MEKCLSEDDILLFIKSKTKSEKIKQHLTNCHRCYDKYIDIKELLYFKDKKIRINKKVINNIVNLYKDYEQIDRFSVVLKATKKAFEVFTTSNIELESEFVSASLIVKGEPENKVDGDTIILKKFTGKYNVFLTIQKLKRDKFQVSVSVYYNKSKRRVKNINVVLKSGEQEIESIYLKEREQFEFLLTYDKYFFEFYGKEKLLFVFDLRLKNE